MSSLEDILGGAPPPPKTPRIIASGEEFKLLDHPEPIETIIARNMRRYFHNPWTMVEDRVIYTLDQTDVLQPVKPFPNETWLELIAGRWVSEPMLALFKSRRMTITWLMIFLHLWLGMFREGAAIFFVSDKEEKSDELVKRAEFIYDHIPAEAMLKPAKKSSYCYLEFPGLNSYIQGVPQGADQLRQYTASAIFADEFAFWPKARETFMASKPTIDGGGKFTCISSPMEGFFKELCFDLIR